MAEETAEEIMERNIKAVEDTIIPLVSSNKYISCSQYTLKIPNFIDLPEYEENQFDLRSPSFVFENATWCFRFYSRRKPKRGFNMDILRLNSEIPEHTVYFHIVPLDAYNVKLDCHGSVFKVNNSCQSEYLCTFMEFHFPQDRSDSLNLAVDLFEFDQTEIDLKQASSTEDSSHNMAYDLKECKVSLKLTMKNIFSTFYSLKLPAVCSSQEQKMTKFDFCTRDFKFADTNCAFNIQSFDVRRFSVDFILKTFRKPLQKVFSKCTLIYNNGKILTEFKVLDCVLGFQSASIACFYKHWGFNKHRGSICTLLVNLLCEEDLNMYELVRARGRNMLSQDFKSLFLTGANSDLTLRVPGKEFLVHQTILKSRSPVFDVMLSHYMIEKNKGIIEVKDIDVETMQLLLSFIYSGEVDLLTLDNVFSVYYAADKYNITFLKKECTDLMKKSLSPLIVCDVMQLAMNHNEKDLLEYSAIYFANHADDITSTDVWVSLMKEDEATANELLAKSKLYQSINS